MESKGKVLSNLAWKFTERMSSQIVTLVVSIIIARLLTPDDYGIVSLVLIFINIGNVLVTAGFGNALIQKKDSDNDDYSSVFFFQIVFSSILYAIVFFLAPFIQNYMGAGYEVLSPALRVLGLIIPISAINNIQQTYVAKKLIFKKFFLSTLVGTLISAGIGITLAYKGFGVWSLVAQHLSNHLINTVVLWFTVKWRPRLIMSGKRLKSLISFGWKIMLSELINVLYNDIRGILIGKRYSSADLAYYDKGQRFPSILVLNVNASIQSVLFPVISKVQNDITALKAITRRAVKMSTYVLLPLLFGLAGVSDNFIIVVLTDTWIDCAIYLRVLCFMFMFYPLGTTNLQVIKALGKGKLYLILEIVKKLIGISILIISAQYGPLYIAYGAVLSIGIESIINYIPNRFLIGYKVRELIMDVISPVCISTIMYIVIRLMNKISINTFALLCLQILCGIAIYVLSSIITRQEQFFYIINFIKKKFKKERSKS